MYCPECGVFLAEAVLPASVQLAVHRWLRHQPAVIQALTIVVLTGVGGWAVKKTFGGR